MPHRGAHAAQQMRSGASEKIVFKWSLAGLSTNCSFRWPLPSRKHTRRKHIRAYVGTHFHTGLGFLASRCMPEIDRACNTTCMHAARMRQRHSRISGPLASSRRVDHFLSVACCAGLTPPQVKCHICTCATHNGCRELACVVSKPHPLGWGSEAGMKGAGVLCNPCGMIN